jgi:hypothetical protein
MICNLPKIGIILTSLYHWGNTILQFSATLLSFLERGLSISYSLFMPKYLSLANLYKPFAKRNINGIHNILHCNYPGGITSFQYILKPFK